MPLIINNLLKIKNELYDQKKFSIESIEIIKKIKKFCEKKEDLKKQKKLKEKKENYKKNKEENLEKINNSFFLNKEGLSQKNKTKKKYNWKKY